MNIVSSRFIEAGGISIQGSADANIVNTIWSLNQLDVPAEGDRIVNWSSGELNIIASTLLLGNAQCDAVCQGDGGGGWIYRFQNGDKINFVQSAVGVNFPSVAPSNLLDGGTGSNSFSADEYTWIQPTGY